MLLLGCTSSNVVTDRDGSRAILGKGQYSLIQVAFIDEYNVEISMPWESKSDTRACSENKQVSPHMFFRL